MTDVDKLLEEADAIIRGTDGDLLDNGQLKITTISFNEFTGEVLANVRGVSGYPVIFPHPESQSILVAREVYFDLLEKGPRIIRQLAELVEDSRKSTKSAKNEAESA